MMENATSGTETDMEVDEPCVVNATKNPADLMNCVSELTATVAKMQSSDTVSDTSANVTEEAGTQHPVEQEVDQDIKDLLESILNSVSEVCDNFMTASAGVPGIVVKGVAKTSYSQKMLLKLANTCQESCDTAESAALDFVVSELHHPVISCFRELGKSDIISVLYNDRLKAGASELEQILICMSLMDYMGASLKNPMYLESFSKRQSAVKPILKKIFLELHRVFTEWAERDATACSEAKAMTVNYLRKLGSFFAAINYEKPYGKAVDLLNREVARAQRKQKPIFAKSLDRSALSEIRSNKDTEGEPKNSSATIDLTEETFDFLDESPPHNQKAAPIFVKQRKNSVKVNSKLSKPTALAKRPLPADSVANSSAKRLCTEQDKPEPVKLDKVDPPSKPSQIVKPVEKICGPKVNAFALLMNRSKELSKQEKLRKQQKMEAALAAECVTPVVN